MPPDRSDLLYGTLEMIVLRILDFAPMHGWGIALLIEQMSGDVFAVNQGSLYPALQRMKRKGWIRSEWRVTSNNRRARYYEITKTGRKELAKARAEWEKTTSAVNGILAWEGGLPA
jgi:PadR family transcriptional regulator PadR